MVQVQETSFEERRRKLYFFFRWSIMMLQASVPLFVFLHLFKHSYFDRENWQQDILADAIHGKFNFSLHDLVELGNSYVVFALSTAFGGLLATLFGHLFEWWKPKVNDSDFYVAAFGDFSKKSPPTTRGMFLFCVLISGVAWSLILGPWLILAATGYASDRIYKPVVPVAVFVQILFVGVYFVRGYAWQAIHAWRGTAEPGYYDPQFDLVGKSRNVATPKASLLPWFLRVLAALAAGNFFLWADWKGPGNLLLFLAGLGPFALLAKAINGARGKSPPCLSLSSIKRHSGTRISPIARTP